MIIPSITIRSVTPIEIPTPTHYFDVYVEGGQLLKDGKTKGVSKTAFLKEYDEFASGICVDKKSLIFCLLGMHIYSSVSISGISSVFDNSFPIVLVPLPINPQRIIFAI